MTILSTLGLSLGLGLTLAIQGAPSAGQVNPAPAVASAPPSYGAPISLAQADSIMERAIAASRARGFRMAIAIVEPSGELVAFSRMDDTQYGSIHIALRKASSSARYRIATATLEERVMAGRLVSLANDDALPIAGGIPIVFDGRIVGAIGVSGATAAQDHEIALEALRQP